MQILSPHVPATEPEPPAVGPGSKASPLEHGNPLVVNGAGGWGVLSPGGSVASPRGAFQKTQAHGAPGWLSGRGMRLDLRVVGSRPTLGVETT